MISSVCWLPRGAAAANPQRYIPTDEQASALRELATQRGTPSSSHCGEACSSSSGLADDEIDKKYGFEDYDEASAPSADPFLEPQGKDDPFLMGSDDDSEDLDDRESSAIRPTDDLIVVSNVSEGDVSTLEVYVYEAEADNLFQHHEILLPAMPLCVEWLDFVPSTSPSQPGNRGSIAAVGSFLPCIELWDLDVIDCLEPLAILGAKSTAGSLLTLDDPERELEYLPDAHKGPVLSLSWNPTYRQLLASGSADNTVKLWDLTTEKAVHTMRHHKDKVQAVKWNPRMGNLLLSGGYDRRVCVVDPKQKKSALAWEVPSDIEAVAWNPHDANIFLASTESGSVHAYDIRQPGKQLFSIMAHQKEVTGLSFNPKVPNMFLTSSTDKTAKIWAVQQGRPYCIQTFNSPCGKIFSAGYAIGAPFVSAIGGQSLEIVNTAQFEPVQKFAADPTTPLATPKIAKPILDDHPSQAGPVVMKPYRPRPGQKRGGHRGKK